MNAGLIGKDICTSNASKWQMGTLQLPARLVSQWQRQIDTPYNELTEKEKDSDREQVMNYIPLISSELSEL